MVQPRLSAATKSQYWLRARSGGTTAAGRILDSLYSIFRPDHKASNIVNVPTMPAIASTPTPTIIRKSARLFEKRAAKLRRGAGPHEYWLRTRTTTASTTTPPSRLPSKRPRSSLLVSVKSLYANSEPQELEDSCEEKSFRACSGCCQPSNSPQRRKSARLFEKRAASLLSCRTTSGSRGAGKISKFKRKKKHICWLYKGTPWLGAGSCYNASKFSAHVRSSKTNLRLDSSDHPGRKDRSGDIASPSGKVRCHDPAFRPVLQRLTERGEEDLLQSILEKLPAASLLQAARVCRTWARLCEPAFREECHRKGWSLPRLPRGATPAFPWRSLYYRHACRACGKVGEFFVRKTLNGNFQFLLCGGCIRLPDVRNRLVQYSIDLYGVTGKLLAPNVSSRGAC